MTDVALNTRQEAKYQGNDWWHWSVWIDGPEEELDAVRNVTYHLHSTFPKPYRRVEDRPSKFRLDSGGWGGFTMRVDIELKDGTILKRRHNLVLKYPDAPERAVRTRGHEPRVKVFLSYSAVDTRIATALKEALTHRAVEVDDLTNLRPGEVFENAIQQKVKSADALIALVSDSSGRAMHSDIQAAIKNETPVVIMELSPPNIPLPELQRIPLTNERDVDQIIDRVVKAIREPKKPR